MSADKPCTHTGRLAALLLAMGLLVPTGCDSGDESSSKSQSNIAKAFASPGKDEAKRKAEEAELAAALAERREREQAEEAALQARVAKAAELPEGHKPRALKKRCNDVADAYDRFTKRRYAEDAKNLMLWYERRRARRAEVRERCSRMPEQTMYCYEQALDNANGDLLELEDRLLKYCIGKFGGSEVLPAAAKGTPA